MLHWLNLSRDATVTYELKSRLRNWLRYQTIFIYSIKNFVKSLTFLKWKTLDVVRLNSLFLFVTNSNFCYQIVSQFRDLRSDGLHLFENFAERESSQIFVRKWCLSISSWRNQEQSRKSLRIIVFRNAEKVHIWTTSKKFQYLEYSPTGFFTELFRFQLYNREGALSKHELDNTDE